MARLKDPGRRLRLRRVQEALQRREQYFRRDPQTGRCQVLVGDSYIDCDTPAHQQHRTRLGPLHLAPAEQAPVVAERLNEEQDLTQELNLDPQIAPPPVAHSTAEPVIMAAPNVPRAEVSARLQVDEQLLDAAHYLTPAEGREPSARKANHAIETTDHILKDLTNSTFTRLAGLQEDMRQPAQAEWRIWKREKDQQLDDIRERYEQLFRPAEQDPEVDTGPSSEVLLAVAQSKIDALVSQIDFRLLQLETEVTGLSDNPVTKATYMELSTRAANINKMLRPDLSDLFDDKAKIDPARHEDFYKELSTQINKTTQRLDKLLSDVHKLQLDDSTFHQPTPGSSTPNQTLNADDITSIINAATAAATTAASTANAKRRSVYDYGKNPLPSFDGDPINYPSWKEEMKNDVLPDKGPKQQLRLIAKLSPNKDLVRLFKTPEEAWDHLDDLYANPVIVAEKVIKSFTDSSTLDGNSDEAKVISLQKRLKALYLTLEVVGEQEQLTHHKPMINQAIKLLPRKYMVEFAKEVIKLQKSLTPTRELTAHEKYNLLSTWLDENAKTFTIYCSSIEDTTSSGSKETEKENRNRNKSRIRTNKRTDDVVPPKPDAKQPSLPGGASIPQDRMNKINEQWKSNGPCPICKEPGHVWKGDHNWMCSQQVNDCLTFRKLAPTERIKAYNDNNLCRRCLSWGHEVDSCPRDETKTFCKKKDAAGNFICKQDHATLLHMDGVTIKSSIVRNDPAWISVNSNVSTTGTAAPVISVIPSKPPSSVPDKDDVMLAIIALRLSAKSHVCALLDNGSNSSIITHSLAKQLGLKGFWTDQIVELAGEVPKKQRVAYYRLSLQFPEGDMELTLVGLDRISSTPGAYSVSEAYKIFPHIPKGSLDKPSGDIELLIGSDHIALMPGGGLGENHVGNLRVFDIPIAPYKVLMGSHPSISFLNPVLAPLVQNYRIAMFTSLPPTPGPLCVNNANLDFLEAEALGVDLSPKCSRCTVPAVDENATALNPFFANRALEINNKMLECSGDNKKYTKFDVTHEFSPAEADDIPEDSTVVDQLCYIPGPQNPADHPSRGNLEFNALDLDSYWQKGPDFLRKKRNEWPLNREGAPLPAEEKRKRFEEANILTNSLQIFAYHNRDKNLSDVFPFSIFSKAKLVMEKARDYEKAQTVFARVVRGYRLGRAAIDEPLEQIDLKNSSWLMALVSVNDFVFEIKKKNNRDSLDIFWRDGLPLARGRMARGSLMSSLGYDALIVLSRHSRLAALIMTSAHCEDHRLGAGDALFRSVRRGYWILQGRRLAQKVVNDCNYCTRVRAQSVSQRMGDLPDLVFSVPVRPFSNICLDFAGPILVKGEVNQRAKRKAYPLLLVCMNTSALHIQLCPDMSVQSFVTQLNHFFAIRGRAQFIYSDQGSQLTSVSKRTAEYEAGERPNLDWKAVRHRFTSSGIEFKHAPAHSQWRDGRSEAMVKAMKHTMAHLNVNGDLSFSELACLLARAADTINQRPLGLRHHSSATTDLCVVTPNLLLQGSRTCAAEEHDGDFEKDMANLGMRLNFIETSFAQWWQLWISAVWPSLVPYRRWKTTERNVMVDDVVMIRYDKKFTKPEFRLGRVLDVFPDDKGRTRTVLVGCRPRHKADRAKAYVPKKLEELTVTVQRLVVLLAAEEQGKLPPANDDPHVCDDSIIISDLPLSKAEKSHPKRTVHFQEDGDPAEAAAIALAAVTVKDYQVLCWRCTARSSTFTEFDSEELHSE